MEESKEEIRGLITDRAKLAENIDSLEIDKEGLTFANEQLNECYVKLSNAVEVDPIDLI